MPDSNAKQRYAAAIPQFALYGDDAPLASGELVHIELIETRSRLYQWEIASHTHRGLFQIVFLLGGQVAAQIDAERHACQAPSVITIHPSVVHGFHFSAEAYGYVVTLDHSLLFGSAGAADLFLQALVIELSAPAAQRIDALLQQMLSEFSQPLHGHTLMLEWLARSVLLLLIRQQAEQRSADQTGPIDFAVFSRLRASVETHYKQQWSVAQHAAALRVSASRLHRLCLKLTGLSVFDLLQQRLMLEARRKLTYVSASISSIAYELGFQDPAYFSRVFKRHNGMTPQEFRLRAAPPTS